MLQSLNNKSMRIDEMNPANKDMDRSTNAQKQSEVNNGEDKNTNNNDDNNDDIEDCMVISVPTKTKSSEEDRNNDRDNLSQAGISSVACSSISEPTVSSLGCDMSSSTIMPQEQQQEQQQQHQLVSNYNPSYPRHYNNRSNASLTQQAKRRQMMTMVMMKMNNSTSANNDNSMIDPVARRRSFELQGNHDVNNHLLSQRDIVDEYYRSHHQQHQQEQHYHALALASASAAAGKDYSKSSSSSGNGSNSSTEVSNRKSNTRSGSRSEAETVKETKCTEDATTIVTVVKSSEEAVEIEKENIDNKQSYDTQSRSSTSSSPALVHPISSPPPSSSEQQQVTGIYYQYTNKGANDSKFDSYKCMVDPQNDDRAIEIVLFSLQRPHMRAFHIAWISFFVCFFTWFAITPLLSEVALSLQLSRKEIWTSSTFAVAGSAVTRVLIGPICDRYGGRLSMSGTLLLISIPTALTGLVNTATGLNILRLFIGIAGSAFVTCQYWTSSMFTWEVAGTANALAAGWGNLGGGVTQIVMGSILFPLFRLFYGGKGYGSTSAAISNDDTYEIDRASDLAWRTVCIVPAVMCVVMTVVVFKYSDDTPKGNYHKRKQNNARVNEGGCANDKDKQQDEEQGGNVPLDAISTTASEGAATTTTNTNFAFQPSSPHKALQSGCVNLNTLIMFIQYGCCFGVEITMLNAAALFFKEEFGQSIESAAAIASVFGWMNLFARGIGGFVSDMTNFKYGMKGRLVIQAIALLIEGVTVIVFSKTRTLGGAIGVMLIFSIFVQAAEGSTYSIVPYVNPKITGTIAGLVGAGGNVGGVIFSLLFREFTNRKAFQTMGFVVMASSLLTVALRIKGHGSLFFDTDDQDVIDRRNNHAEQLNNKNNNNNNSSSFVANMDDIIPNDNHSNDNLEGTVLADDDKDDFIINGKDVGTNKAMK